MKNSRLMEKVFPGLLLILTIILIPGALLFTASDALAVGPYVDNGDGTVTDSGAGLMWQQSGDGLLRNWCEAQTYCGDLVLAEFDDWRLPEVDELAGLKETTHPIPWINDIFDCYPYLYWSGTTSSNSSISAWAISFTTGGGVDGKQNPYYVRCTRDNSVSGDTQAPTGAVHAYDNMIWPPNNKMVTVTLEGYVKDELSMARDGEGIGVSKAYLLIGSSEEIILRDGTIDKLSSEGRFSVNIEVRAVKGAEYVVELYAADTESADDGGPNSGLVDSTFIRVPHDMSDDKSKK